MRACVHLFPTPPPKLSRAGASAGHLSHGPPKLRLVIAAAECQVLHNDVTAAPTVVAIVEYLGDAHGAGVVHGHEP